jgi:hypothetical protein
MNSVTCLLTGAFAVIVLAALPSGVSACTTCGCSLSTDAAVGYSDTPGWRATPEVDFINRPARPGSARSSDPSAAALAPPTRNGIRLRGEQVAVPEGK